MAIPAGKMQGKERAGIWTTVNSLLESPLMEPGRYNDGHACFRSPPIGASFTASLAGNVRDLISSQKNKSFTYPETSTTSGMRSS
jgi:hypothetical protein